MSPEYAARAEAAHVTNVANLALAIARARGFDPARISCGVAIAAACVAGDDTEARTALAVQMLSLVRELDGEVLTAVWQ